MRTTLDIEDDVLFAAKEVAKREKKNRGRGDQRMGSPFFSNATNCSQCARTTANNRGAIGEIWFSSFAAPRRDHHQ